MLAAAEVAMAVPFRTRLALRAAAGTASWATGLARGAAWVDDHVIISGTPALTAWCEEFVDNALALAATPAKQSKREHADRTICFTGSRYDLVHLERSLPAAKQASLLQKLSTWRARRHCSVRDAQRLHGLLVHVARFVPVVGAFVSGLVAWIRAHAHLHPRRQYRLGRELRHDIGFISFVCDPANGMTWAPLLQTVQPSRHEAWTDASPVAYGICIAGFGVCYGRWDPYLRAQHINVLETVAVAYCLFLMGAHGLLDCCCLTIHIDNTTALNQFSSSPSSHCRHLRRVARGPPHACTLWLHR